jgi:2-oxoglutarate ferredoxin oxidoreductase subunit alpha
MSVRTRRPGAREAAEQKVRLMQGNEACAEGALAAGCRFFAGYPITPASEIAEYLSLRLPREGGNFIQMEDEIASMAAIIGASIAGVKSMTATSGPGFSLKQENIGFASMAEIPCVIVNVMRCGPSTGLPTGPSQGDLMQTRWGTHGDHPIIVLAPSSVLEVYQETLRAFNLSELFRSPVILLMDEILAHMREKVRVPESSEITVVERLLPDGPAEEYLPYANDRDVSPLAPFGRGYRFHITGLYHDESGFPTGSPEQVRCQAERLMGKLERGHDRITRVEYQGIGTEEGEAAEVLVVSFGSTARAAGHAVKEACRQGKKVGLFRPVTVWPFPEQELRKACKGAGRVVVPEMSFGQLAGEVAKYLPPGCTLAPLHRIDGIPLTPDEILEKIMEVS